MVPLLPPFLFEIRVSLYICVIAEKYSVLKQPLRVYGVLLQPRQFLCLPSPHFLPVVSISTTLWTVDTSILNSGTLLVVPK